MKESPFASRRWNAFTVISIESNNLVYVIVKLNVPCVTSEYNLGESDVDEFLAALDKQLAILDATVHHRNQFETVVTAQEQLRLVHIHNWAGLGAVQ